MDDDGINFRFLSLERENEERKKENDERIIADKVTSHRIVEIEKISIKQTIILNAIMWTVRALLGIFIILLASNFYMFLARK